ncbi:P2Y purinoceptor 1-like [Hyperolius riggenbachi]|uniref:P2Y purinoceptor 1-like n=1 Tax=Hyperolius riggenbachi TaxID=752182 RepID=UPI0035A3941F
MLNSSMNSTGCQPQHINPFIPIFLTFIFFIGFTLNCISVWIFWFKVKQWNSTVVLQFNLAVSDAIITPAVPLIVAYSLTDHWTFGLFLCQFKVFLLSTHMYGSIYFLTVISIHRYFTVAHNVRRKTLTTKPFITKLCLIIWGCLLCQGIPFFFVLKISDVHGVTKCLSIHQSEQAVLFFVWNWIILFSGLLIPFSITLVCYSLLIRYIRKVNPMNTLSKVMVSREEVYFQENINHESCQKLLLFCFRQPNRQFGIVFLSRMLNANATQNFTGCIPYSFHIYVPICLSLIFAFGFILNSTSLWIFWFRVKRWNSTVVLQFNLAISDAIITLAVPLTVIYTVTSHWTFGTFSCQLMVFLFSTHMYGSIYFLTMTSLHRYFTIAHHGKRSSFISKPFITKCCLVVWAFLGVQGIPYFFTVKSSEVHGVPNCLSINQHDQKLLLFAVNWVILFTSILIPFSVMVICYSLLTRFILKVNPVNPLSKVMVSKSLRMITVPLTILCLCYLPSHVSRTVALTVSLFFPKSCPWLRSIEDIYTITWVLSELNCCLDPILYCFASDRFKYIFLGLARLDRPHRNQDNSEEHQTGTTSGARHLSPLPTTSSTEIGLSKC